MAMDSLINICYTCFDSSSTVSLKSLINAEPKDHRHLLHLFLFADYQQNCAQDVQQIQSLCKQENVQVTLLPFERIKDFCNQRNFPSYHGYLLNYARLFLPELLPDVHKIIYLDSDTLVLKPIDQLWTESLNGMPIGAVHSYDASFGNGSALEKRETFNDGVLLMDLDALRSQGFIEWVRQLTSKDIDGCLDQGIVETFCFSKTEYLPLKYNSLCFLRSLSYRQYLKDYSDFRRLSKKEFYVAQRKPVIVHFNGNAYDRPWHQYSRSKYLFLWRRLYRQVYRKALKPQPFPKTSLKMRIFRRIMQSVAICLPGRFYYWLSNAIGGKRFR